MKYYVVLVQTFVDGSASAKSIFEYDSKNAALSAYHYNLSTSLLDSNIKTVYCECFNDVGVFEDRKFVQVAPIPDEEDNGD